MADVMIISPHPDDAEICMGGTITKMVKKKLDVVIVDLTNGEPTPYGNPAIRAKETRKASEILGIQKRVNLGLPNREVKDFLQARVLVANQIRKFRPTIIFAPHISDIHPDHRETSKISEAARFYAKFHKAKYMGLKWQPHFPSKIFFYYSFHQIRQVEISFVIDISENFYEKMKAIKAYRSQFIMNKKNKALLPIIETHLKYYGSLVNCEYGEPFFSYTAIKISQIKQLINLASS